MRMYLMCARGAGVVVYVIWYELDGGGGGARATGTARRRGKSQQRGLML